ncbi:MAG TPA: hypothetical protein V6C97_13895 [Oculatellaceae cyanobacterium]
MSDQPGATTSDASPLAKHATTVIGDKSQALKVKAADGSNDSSNQIQLAAAHKILDEVSPGPKILGGLINADTVSRAIPVASLPDAGLVQSQAVSSQTQSKDSTAADIPVKVVALERHDASFFQHDLLHNTERVLDVWRNSCTTYLKQGLEVAAKENMQKDVLTEKLAAGALLGVSMRTLLPKQGIVRAVAATVMTFNMARDLASPFYQGAKDAIDSKDDKELDTAARKASLGVGSFIVDNAIALPAAGLGEMSAGRVLEAHAPRFEARKEALFNSDKSRVGQFLNHTAANVDSFTAKVGEKIKPTDPDVLAREADRKAIADLPAPQKLARVEDVANDVRKHYERSQFYKHGPKAQAEEDARTGTKLPVPDSEKPLTYGGVKRIVGKNAETGEPNGTSVPHAGSDKDLSFSQNIDRLLGGEPQSASAGPKIDIDESLRLAGIMDGGQSHGIIGPIKPGDRTGRPGSSHDVAISPDDLNPDGGDGYARTGRKGGGDTETSGVKGRRRRKQGDSPSKTTGTGTDTTVDGGKGTAGDTAKDGGKPTNEAAKDGQKDGQGDRTSDKKGKVTDTSSSPKDDLKSSVFAKTAAVVKAVQGLWSTDQVKLADARDQFEGPITAATELNKAPLPPEYKPSTQQLKDLISQIDSADNLKSAGMFLMYHMKAANQLLFNQDNVRDLNMFTNELAGVFLKGMRKLGIPEDRLRRIIPSLVTETNDNGSGYFTNPPIDGVIDRPVTVVPRAFSRLISVMSDVIRHEALGHDHTYPELARFPEKDRDNLIRGAISKTMKEEGVPEKNHRMNGETIPTSELLFRLLKAEANENTSDFMGTASGGIGTPVSLGVLLQSLRDGGLLETRNVYGKEFEDGIEPHGIDRWRIKFCAEVMRQLAPKDKTTTEYADALDQYAQEASRPGDTYIWASTDKPGEKVELPMKVWDAVIPRIVQAQLDTPLDTLKDVNGNRHTLREMLGDNHANIVRGIDDLANQFVDAIRSGHDELPDFDKTKYTIGQVFSAGLVAWLRATRHDVDPVQSLKTIDKISSTLRAQYREYNPNEVPLTTPTSVKLMQTLHQSPGQILRSTGRALVDRAPYLRTAADRSAGILAGSAATDVVNAGQWLYNEAHSMADTKRQVLTGTTAQNTTDADNQTKFPVLERVDGQ